MTYQQGLLTRLVLGFRVVQGTSPPVWWPALFTSTRLSTTLALQHLTRSPIHSVLHQHWQASTMFQSRMLEMKNHEYLVQRSVIPNIRVFSECWNEKNEKGCSKKGNPHGVSF